MNSNSLASGVVAVEEGVRKRLRSTFDLRRGVEEALYFQGTFLEKIGDTVGAEGVVP